MQRSFHDIKASNYHWLHLCNRCDEWPRRVLIFEIILHRCGTTAPIIHVLMYAIRAEFCGCDIIFLEHIAHFGPECGCLHLFYYLRLIISQSRPQRVYMYFENVSRYFLTEGKGNLEDFPWGRWEGLRWDHDITVVSICYDALFWYYDWLVRI